MTTPRAQHDLAANTLRALAIDATNAADSGHPGAPLGMADLAVVLWTEFLRFDPTDPRWPDRDRFVLSNGHASMLLYGLLHLAGYDLSLDELKRFRQLHSKTPGHPEWGVAPGVETTTGPLGQGFANAVGMAIAHRMAAARFSATSGPPLFDQHVYVFAGDGCLMEGISSEAASIAGHLGLDDLVVVYDDNHISIDGGTQITFTENVETRFLAYGWRVLRVDGHDPAEIRAALTQARTRVGRPTLVIARTHIGFGSPGRQDTAKAHGSPLGADEGAKTKAKLGWTYPPFTVPDEARALFAAQADRGKAEHAAWRARLETERATDPARIERLEHFLSGVRPATLVDAALAAVGREKNATRNSSSKALNAIAREVEGLIGGSADLAESTKTLIAGSGYFGRPERGQAPGNRNLAFGVREHAMGAIVNGLALWGGFTPFGATFLSFSDYMRPPIRLAALMKLRSLFVFTHDSIYLGEDGPTHQAVEHAWALRLIPGLDVWRPADALETAMAWVYAVAEGEERPHALLFTRQNLPFLDRPAGFAARDVWRGAYVVSDAADARLSLVATGSEVHVAMEAAAQLAAQGLPIRVVSMPCVERFRAQDAAYRRAVLPDAIPVATFEAGRTEPWAEFTGRDGIRIGLDRFGESAPAEQLQTFFGLDATSVAKRIAAALAAPQAADGK